VFYNIDNEGGLGQFFRSLYLVIPFLLAAIKILPRERDLTLFIVNQLRKIVPKETGQYVFNPEHFIAIILNKDQIQIKNNLVLKGVISANYLERWA